MCFEKSEACFKELHAERTGNFGEIQTKIKKIAIFGKLRSGVRILCKLPVSYKTLLLYESKKIVS